MTALNSYSTGTVSVAANGTTVTGAGTNWSGTNVRPGDVLQIGDFQTIITDVTDTSHLVIPPWGGGVQSGALYVVWQVSPQRFAGAQAMADVSTLVAALNTTGFYVFVDSSLTAPDPSLGEENQFALQASSGKMWLKTGGAWVYQGIYKALNILGAYDSSVTYSEGDVVAQSGSSYVWSNATPGAGHAPPDSTYWTLLAAKGDKGDKGDTGASYAATSTTSLTIGTGAQTFATQAGLAYVVGARVRISSGANYMEGLVTAYSGTSMTVNVSKASGAGTFAAWNINVAGDPGSGDMLSTNNLSDVTNPASALSNLQGLSFGTAQTLTPAQKAQARANSGAGAADGSVVFTGVADARAVSDAAMTSGSATLTSATAVFTAAHAGKTIMVAGAGASGATLTTTISGFTNVTTVTLAAPASTTVSAALCFFGTNNSTTMATTVASATTVLSTGGGVLVPTGSYLFANSVVLPQGRTLSFKSGLGVRMTQFICATDGIALFSYNRASGVAASIFEFEGIQFQLASSSKAVNSAAIYSTGFSDAQADNYLRAYKCWFYGFNSGIQAKWTGQSKVRDCFFVSNSYSINLARGCNQWDISGNMSFDATFVTAQDTTYDAYSNGLTLRANNHITGTAESLNIQGYQSVYADQCGFDLGSGGQAAVYLLAVQDYTITNCYISSNSSTTRCGVLSNQSYRGTIAHNRIVNNSIGVHVFGVNGTATQITTLDNKFNGNATNDLVWNSYSTCCKHIGNHHSLQMARTGSAFEIYGNITGVDYNVIAFNTFHGSTYTITAGANTQQSSNIFGVPAG